MNGQRHTMFVFTTVLRSKTALLLAVAVCLASSNSASLHVYADKAEISSPLPSVASESARTAADKLIQRGMTRMNSARFSDAIGDVIEESGALGKKAPVRQRAVIEALGQERYEKLKTIVLRGLASRDISEQHAALGAVGADLACLEATEVVRPFVFSENPLLQLRGIEALAALDVPGCTFLLDNIILSGLHQDFQIAATIRVLHICGDPQLPDIGRIMIRREDISAVVVAALLPAIKGTADFRTFAFEAFRSGRFEPSTLPRSTLEEDSKLAIERLCLKEAVGSSAGFMEDETLRKKVMRLARDSEWLWPLALTVLEKAGADVAFFEDLLSQDRGMMEAKRRSIELAIYRIKNGKRLEYK